MTDSLPVRAPAGLGWLDTPWLRPFNDWDAIEDLLAPLKTTWSATRIRARVVALRPLAADVLGIALRPNARWPGFEPGQHVAVEVEINGRRLRRHYSLTSAPQQPLVSIAVKRHAGGRVSGWLHECLRVGDIVTLGAPGGTFRLPQAINGDVLMIGAGSGVAPLWSLLQALHARAPTGCVDFIQICRSPAHALFAQEIEALAAVWPALRLHTYDTSQRSRPGMDELLAAVPGALQRVAFICGPEPLMQAARDRWSAAGAEDRLHWERFGPPPGAAGGEQVMVQCRASARRFPADTGRGLLDQAERAGLQPRHGCRAGICHSCRYRKRSGITRNLLTGQVSAEPGEVVQLCISSACSDLEFDDL